MMKKSILYVLMAAFVLASCSKSEDPAPVNNDGLEFSVRSSVIDVNANANSRVAYTGNDLATNNLTALVLTSETSCDYTTLFCNGTMTFVGGSTTDNVVYNKPVTSGSYLLAEGGNDFYLSALYPATVWDLTTTSGKALFTLTGKEDVMFASEKPATKAGMSSTTYPLMEFKHQLALLRLWFSGSQDAVDLATTVTNIALTHVGGVAVPTDVEIDLSTSSQPVTFSAPAPNTTLACYGIGVDTDFATTHTAGYIVPVVPAVIAKAYTLVPPTPITAEGSYEYTFKVDYTVDSVDKSLSVNVDLNGLGNNVSTVGYAFDIKLNFVSGQIQAVASVTDWVEGGSKEIPL